ncbi:MAG: hypothetical protein EBV03_10140 [Proteobacteria bacterium]|nr:hypothetical protein [Pseudomonadota bacterium]
MSSESDDPESTIPWPGFVDILSTVIIVFVFFMMMTSVIIFVLSEQAKRAAVSEAQKRAESPSEVDQKSNKTSPDQTLSPDISNLLREKEALQKEVERLTQLKTVLSESEQQQTALDGNVMTITFGDLGATITKETGETIKTQLPYEGKVQIVSYIPKGSDFGSIREIAFNRAMNIRNVLMQGGMPGDKITLKILAQNDDDMRNKDNFYGSVTLTFE